MISALAVRKARNLGLGHAMLRLLPRAILTASLTICSADAFAETHMIGLGNQTCATWTANPPIDEVKLLYHQWILGFQSGASFADPNHNPLNSTDASSVAVWFSDYCRDNSTAHLVDAAAAFVRSHQPAKN